MSLDEDRDDSDADDDGDGNEHGCEHAMEPLSTPDTATRTLDCPVDQLADLVGLTAASLC